MSLPFNASRLLEQRILLLNVNSLDLILNDIDCFVSESRGNESVEDVIFYPHTFNDQDDDLWDKLGQALGNLQALESLCITNENYDGDHDDPPVHSDWRELAARILSQLRQNVTVEVDSEHLWYAGEVQALAHAIRGHPTIIGFRSNRCLPYESMDSLYSALATLPALEAVKLSAIRDDGTTLANPESLRDLLRVPSLRSVSFYEFHFTSALCQATANALTEGTAITDLEFSDCSFYGEGGAAVVVNGLSTNTSVTSFAVALLDEAFYSALAAALQSNSTLGHLDLSDDGHGLLPVFLAVFLALGKKYGA
jgi:hypothetical protein